MKTLRPLFIIITIAFGCEIVWAQWYLESRPYHTYMVDVVNVDGSSDKFKVECQDKPYLSKYKSGKRCLMCHSEEIACDVYYIENQRKLK